MALFDASAFSPSTRAFVEKIAPLVEGLELISDSDSMVQPIAFRTGAALASLTSSDIGAGLESLRHLRPMAWEEWHGPLDERLLERRALSDFQPHFGDDEEDDRRWAAAAAAFGATGEAEVFRLGTDSDDDVVEGTVDVFVLRQTAPGELAGVWMVSIET
jgi:hypothetical protein